MVAQFGNCAYSYKNSKEKPVFVPSDEGRKLGKQLKLKVESRFNPPWYFFHLQKGGHVAALHIHRKHRYFARVDIENFFYTVSRNRIARCLQKLGIGGGERFAKWSTIKNPYGEPTYSLPYGFVQSALLASLALAHSPVGTYLHELSNTVAVSVFMDDIAISGNNRRILERAYRKLIRNLAASPFKINVRKSQAPGLEVELFNCHMERLKTLVTEERRAVFYSTPRSEFGVAAFAAYCRSVQKGNS